MNPEPEHANVSPAGGIDSLWIKLEHAVAENQIAYISGWLGITQQAGEPGAKIRLAISRGESYLFNMPEDIRITVGAVVYLNTAFLHGHTPTASAFGIVPGPNRLPLFKALSGKPVGMVQVLGYFLGN